MATPIRKKRNFKALQLNVNEQQAPAQPPPPDPVSIRTAPTALGPRLKKKPPPMTLAAPKINSVGSAVTAVEPQEGTNDNAFLVVSNGPSSAPLTGSGNVNVRRNTLHTTLTNTIAALDINKEMKFDLRNEDLVDIHDLGQGNGGSVKKVEHTPTKTFMAKKVRVSIHNTLLVSF
jgi:mitogen-activated protein kinase kinase